MVGDDSIAEREQQLPRLVGGILRHGSCRAASKHNLHDHPHGVVALEGPEFLGL